MTRLLDLGCGAGGASWGYHLAGFDVTGVDIVDQPRYPLRFIQGDAVEYLDAHGHEYDVITGSPPCQRYSRMSGCRPGLADTYPDLVGVWREKIASFGVPYVLENVEGAPLVDPVMLCTFMFGRETYRHRLFESNVPLAVPEHPRHVVPASKAGHWVPGTFISVAGHCAPVWKAREVMGIDWCRRSELVEAIPPYFTEFLGRQLLAADGSLIRTTVHAA